MDPSVDGIKTGETKEAGYCLAAPAKRDEMRLIAIVMGAFSKKIRTKIAQTLLEYGFGYFETKKLYIEGTRITQAGVWCGQRRHVFIGVAEDVYVTIPRGAASKISQKIKLKKPLIAPLVSQEVVGEVQVF